MGREVVGQVVPRITPMFCIFLAESVKSHSSVINPDAHGVSRGVTGVSHGKPPSGGFGRVWAEELSVSEYDDASLTHGQVNRMERHPSAD
jgi:hypothetical protein